MTKRWPIFLTLCALALGVTTMGCEEEHLKTPTNQQGADTRSADEASAGNS